MKRGHSAAVPERRRRLKQTLAELHRDLEDTEQVDDALRDELRATAREIEALLDAQRESEEPVSERLRELALRFEGTHPRLAETVNRLVLGLAELGI